MVGKTNSKRPKARTPNSEMMTEEMTLCRVCKNPFPSQKAEMEVAGAMIKFAQTACDDCIEEYEARTKESRTKLGRIPWEEIAPPLYQQKFEMDLLPELTRPVATKVFEWKNGPRGVGLIGNSRTGKTPIMFELMRRWYETGASVMLSSGVEFASQVGSLGSGRETVIQRAQNCDMLFLDDIGKEKFTERVEADLYAVLEHRRRYLRPVFATVNSRGDVIAGKMSADGGIPIVNRLKYDLCEFLHVESK